MRVLATLLAVALCVFLLPTAVVSAPLDPIVIVFYEDGCPSCEEMDELLTGMMIETPETAIVRYEITEPESFKLLADLARAYDIEIPSIVPIVFVADDVVIGMGRTQEFALRNAIGDCLSIGCESPIARLPISQLRADLPRLALFLAVFLAIVWFQIH
jgi:thiol-disulfide isomerase/thioredoxin